MIYLTGCSSPAVRELAGDLPIGLMATPGAYTPGEVAKYPMWAADNGCYRGFRMGAWWRYMDDLQPYAATCLFAVVPDVVADAEATEQMFIRWSEGVRRRGFPVAFVAQDGLRRVPWVAIDVLFIGGTTDFKLSPFAEQVGLVAKAHGKHVHVGRVNSARRLARFAALGFDSADGTFLAYGPDRNLPRLRSWLERPLQRALWDHESRIMNRGGAWDGA